MRVLIMAGGTGGHIFPALAVAKKLLQQEHIVHWLGTKNGMEVDIAQANNIPISCVSISGLRGKGLFTKLFAPIRLVTAMLQSMFIMWRFKADVVLGMGGYVTGPAGIAAWLLRKKLVIHEQNAIAGMTNQILAKFSSCVLEAFPSSFPRPISAKLTGNPVREDFYRLLPPEKRSNKNSSATLKVLVLGGSGGARALNNIMPQILSTWNSVHKIMVWHQAGSKHINDAKQAYLAAGLNVEANSLAHNSNIKLVDFIQDMPNAYAWADIVICRAGALTIAELAVAGVASILIPFPYAVDDHQTKNAQYLVKAGAAIILPEKDLTAQKLQELLQAFAMDQTRLITMAKAAYKLAKPEALAKVVEYCLA
mgnify:CR=1 FL=1